MAKKKIIIKKQADDKKAKKKTIQKVKVKGKKSKKKAKATIEQAIIDKDELIDAEKTSEEIDALELDEVSEEISAFEEETSEIEKEVLASEEEFEEEIQEERIYTVPLAKDFMKTKNWKRTKRAVKTLRKFAVRHMKPEGDMVFISQDVNERLWENGIKKPPRKIRVRMTKSTEGLVRVYLA